MQRRVKSSRHSTVSSAALTGDMLVIADAEKPVALAGIMGGEESEISTQTTDVLIESAYFNPDSVRQTARKLGMDTEASRRFERGADCEGVLRAQQRCVELICEIAGGVATEDAIDVYPQPLQRSASSVFVPAELRSLRRCQLKLMRWSAFSRASASSQQASQTAG